MTSGNYVRHFKVLGKLAKLFDIASAQTPDLNTLMARLYDQVATGETASLPGVLLLAQYVNSFQSAIARGPESLAALAKAMAEAYLISNDFVNDLTTTPTSRTGAAVLTALQTEMAAGLNNKTLTTLAATGLVNFFNQFSPTSSWNTAADASADYKDSVYVVSTIV